VYPFDREQGKVAASCEGGNELRSVINGSDFLDTAALSFSRVLLREITCLKLFPY
jgi:hypothetical protein